VANVKASCPTCGDVELTTRQMQVQLCTAVLPSSYSFLCPACATIVNKPASTEVVGVLSAAGVEVRRWEPPAELDERKSGPPITHDDLLGFHFALQRPGCLEELVAGRSER